MVCLRGKTAKYRKVEEVWPPLKFNFTYWVVFSGWFGQENYEKSCHFGLVLSSLALDIWRLDIWRLQTSDLKIPATKKVETPQVILLSCNGIPGILTIAWPIFSQLMTTEHSRDPENISSKFPKSHFIIEFRNWKYLLSDLWSFPWRSCVKVCMRAWLCTTWSLILAACLLSSSD